MITYGPLFNNYIRNNNYNLNIDSKFRTLAKVQRNLIHHSETLINIKVKKWFMVSRVSALVKPTSLPAIARYMHIKIKHSAQPVAQ